MTIQLTRRKLLRNASGLLAVSAAARFAGLGTESAQAAEGSKQPHSASIHNAAYASINHSLQQAVDNRTLAGVVAMGATRDGLIYEGAFGHADLQRGVSWAGLLNSYFWLDPVRRVAGAMFTQVLPFYDPAIVDLYGQFEAGLYGALRHA